MFSSFGLRTILKSSVGVLRESSALYPAVSVRPWSCCASDLLSGPAVSKGVFAVPPPVRHYARVAKKKKTGPESQLSDLPPTMVKMEYASVPLLCYLCPQKEKLQLKKEQLIAKVQRDENDRNSVEVQVAVLTARIRNYQEHLQKHHKDKANKRRMLMAIDRRKKLLKNLRLVRFDTFERVCEQLGITYTFPPEYYRRATRRWLAKKEFCIKVFKALQKQKAEQKMKQQLSNTETKEAKAPEAQT
uniref:Small ribosomal subunit protein uS15m n=1 Tax=Xiphophorus couchianus TaxID=32473 RepID=A0A3B5L213_9TELE